jgi:carbohydrate-binding DOMON domain-containing protein
MKGKLARFSILAAVVAAFFAAAAGAQEVAFRDPTGDDNGPGKYTYPTDAVYKPGSFDLTQLKVKKSGANVDFEVSVNSALDDPWRMGVGFAVQMVFIFVKTGDAKPSYTQGLPGLNIQFAPEDAWNRCVILSPQPSSRVKAEVDAKAPSMKAEILVPVRTKGSGKTISGSVSVKDFPSGDPSTWGYQVIMQSNEGFPAKTDLLTRKVNEYEGQHRFGGGNDGDCDPHVMDILAGSGNGDASEVDLQHKMLAYECNPDGTAKQLATLRMVYRKK